MEDVNIAFDSFEFDDRLLSKLDAEVFEEKENSQNRSIVLLCSSKKKNFVSKEISLNDTDIIKKQYYNLPLSINDLSTSNSNNKPGIKTEENDSIKVFFLFKYFWGCFKFGVKYQLFFHRHWAYFIR